jgi:hypothetical protein
MLGANSFAGRRKSLYLSLAVAAALICLVNLIFLTRAVDHSIIRLPGLSLFRPKSKQLDGSLARDEHPIVGLMNEANNRWQEYENSRSTNFRQATPAPRLQGVVPVCAREQCP